MLSIFDDFLKIFKKDSTSHLSEAKVPSKTMPKLKIAIIGIGHLGSRHLKVLHALRHKVEIVAVCDIKHERTQRLARHYRAKFIEDYKTLLGRVDAVTICVPTVAHYEVAKFFLVNGVHTMVEKPFTMTVSQADDLIDIAQKKNLKLQVGHVERFNSAFQSVKHFCRNPLFIECHRLNRFPNRSLDIGVVMDLMIHDIDIILGLIQAPVKDIQAIGINVLTPLEDIASVRLTMGNGCICNLTASRVSDEVTRKIRMFVQDAYISLDYVKQEAFIYRKTENRILKHSLPIEKEEPLKAELESFIDCVRENKEPIVGGIEGRNALKVALDIGQKILETKKNILELSQIDKLTF